MSDIFPSGNLAYSDAGHEADHANIADMLGLLHQKGCAEKIGTRIKFMHIARILNGVSE